MNTKQIILTAALAAALTTSALAQVEVTLTGSTAFRSIVHDRVASLLDAGYTTTSRDSNIRTYAGTMNTVFTPGTPVIVRMSWSGSASGMKSVQLGSAVNTVSPGDTNTLVGKTPDLAYSDVFPSSANPPIPNSAFAQRDVVGIVPFVFVRNNTASTLLNGINNITREQAVMLMTMGGLMPASFLGGNNENPIYLIGRDAGSGTRITTEKVIAFKGSPTLFAKVGGNWVTTNGFSSGSTVSTTITNNADAIGYLGLADFSAISNNAVPLSFNGVPYTPTNVLNGKYTLWGYQHCVSRIGMSASQQTFRTKLIEAITNADYQRTNANYVGKFEILNDMQVERGADGGSITSTVW